MPKQSVNQIEGVPATTDAALITKGAVDTAVGDVAGDLSTFSGATNGRIQVLEDADYVAFEADGSLLGTDGAPGIPALPNAFVTHGAHDEDLEIAFGLIDAAARSGGDLVGSLRNKPTATRGALAALAGTRTATPGTASIMAFGDSALHGLNSPWWPQFITNLRGFNDSVAAVGFVPGSIDAYVGRPWRFELITGSPGTGGGNVEVVAGLGGQAFALNAGSAIRVFATSGQNEQPVCDKITFCWSAQRLASMTCALQFRVDGVLIYTTTAADMVDGTLVGTAKRSGRMHVHTPTYRGAHKVTVTAVSITGATGSSAIFDGAHLHDGNLDHWNAGHVDWTTTDFLDNAAPNSAYLTAVDPDIVLLAFGIADYQDDTPAEFGLTTEYAVGVVQAAAPEATIILVSMFAPDAYPNWALYVDAMDAVASTRGLLHVDLFGAMGSMGATDLYGLSDGTNLTEKGAVLVANLVAEVFTGHNADAPLPAWLRDNNGDWWLGSPITVLEGNAITVHGGVIRQAAAIRLSTSQTVTGNNIADVDFAIGTSIRAHMDQILDNQLGFLGPIGFSAGTFIPQYAGSTTPGYAFPSAAIEVDGAIQYKQSASGYGGAGVGFQAFKVIKNLEGSDANISGYQPFLSVPFYMADGQDITMAATTGEATVDGVVGLHQGFCDWPVFGTNFERPGTLSGCVSIGFESQATFGLGATGTMRWGYKFEDAQTDLHKIRAQIISIVATGGTFTLTYNGDTTDPIAYNAAPSSGPASVRALLEALSTVGIGDVLVSAAGPNKYQVRYVQALLDATDQITVDGTNLTGPSHAISIIDYPDVLAGNILGFTEYGTLAKQTALDIPYLTGAAVNVGIRNGSTTVYPPQPTLGLTATSTIPSNMTQVHVQVITAGTGITLTSNPQIAPGVADGQYIRVTNMDLNVRTLTLHDGAGLSLPSGNNLSLRPSQSAEFLWWAAGELWMCCGRSQGGLIDTGPVLGTGSARIWDEGSSTLGLQVFAADGDANPRSAFGQWNGFGAVRMGAGGGNALNATMTWGGPGIFTVDHTISATTALTAPTVTATTSVVTPTVAASTAVTAPQITATGLTGAVAGGGRWVGVTAALAPTTGNFVAGDWVISNGGRIWVCILAGGPGTWIQANTSLADGQHLALGTGLGTKIGTGTTQHLGFWGATPVQRPTAVPDATGGTTVDAEARTALNNLLARLRTIGLLA